PVVGGASMPSGARISPDPDQPAGRLRRSGLAMVATGRQPGDHRRQRSPIMARRYTGVSGSILDAIHDTPLLELEEGIFVKCEFLNPSGSIKARIARYIIERAEREGLI